MSQTDRGKKKAKAEKERASSSEEYLCVRERVLFF